MTVQLRLLGPVEVWAGRAFDVGEPRRRTVFASLLMDVGTIVPSYVLVERVWGQVPPRQAVKTLGTHVTRIRRVLERVAGGVASTGVASTGVGQVDGATVPIGVAAAAGGYRLDVDRDLVDVHVFRRLVREARQTDDVNDRVTLLQEAVGLWRGEPLTGLAGDWADRTREQLDRERLDAVTLWAEAEIGVGNAEATIAPLSELADNHRLHEPLTAALMRALAAAGRPTEALERCAVHRQWLADEYGTDQSAALRQLYEAILRSDGRSTPAKSVPSPTRSPVEPALDPVRPHVAPAQIPAEVAAFAGRARELARLDRLLPEPNRPTAAVCAVYGTAGVGKTALVAHWARRVAAQFPDGQLYANLRAFGPASDAVDPVHVVRGFLHALGVPPGGVPPQPDEQAALYRSMLAGRRVLIVLDNVRDSAQVRPLLPGHRGCLVIVTSRTQLTGLIAADGAVPVAVDVLNPNEARELLSRRLDEDRLAAEPGAVDDIIRGCARLPLALALVAAHALIRPTTSLATLAEHLRRDSRWNTLSSDDPAVDVRAVLSWSYRSTSPAAQRLFRLLAVHPGPDITVTATASLAAMSAMSVHQQLAELVQASLVTEHGTGRFDLHDLLRAYAAELPDRDRPGATRRLLDHYLHTAAAADDVLQGGQHTPLGEPAAGALPEVIVDARHAWSWFTAEEQVLLAVLDHAVEHRHDAHVCHLAWAVWDFFLLRGSWQTLASIGFAALAAAQRLDDPELTAQFRVQLGSLHLLLGNPAHADCELREGLRQYQDINDGRGTVRAHNALASLREQQGDPHQALDHAYQALRLCETINHPRGLARALNSIGRLHGVLGAHDQMLKHCTRARDVFQQAADRQGEAAAWDNLGQAHHRLGAYDEAITCYGHSIALNHHHGGRYHEAVTLDHLAQTHIAVADQAAAERSWRQALAILDEIEHPDARHLRAKLRGA